jgi:hypothetical protein
MGDSNCLRAPLKRYASEWGRELGRICSSVSLFAFLIVACKAMDANPLGTEPSQSDVEAVYLFDFGKFVRWPGAGADAPFSICAAAPQPFVDGLQGVVANEHIEGHSLAVRRVLRAEQTQGCSILFIDASEKEDEPALLAACENKPMLTVSDLPGFLGHGGMVQFLLVGKRVRFSVNLDAVNHSSLAMSSELLKVAVSVKGTPAGGVQ